MIIIITIIKYQFLYIERLNKKNYVSRRKWLNINIKWNNIIFSRSSMI